MNWILLLISILLIASVSSLTIQMERREPYCFGILGNSTYNYEMQYVAMGKGKISVKYELYDPINNIIHTGNGNRTAYLTQQVYSDGLYTICFTNQGADNIKLSFDLMATADEATPEILEKEHLTMIEYELRQLKNDLEKVNHVITEHASKVQQQIYTFDLKKNEKNEENYNQVGTIQAMKRWALWKCVVIVVIALTKIFVMMKYFDVGEKARTFLGLSMNKNHI